MAALLLAAAAVAAWYLARPRTAGPFVLVSIDTLRADHLAVYGYTNGRTPVLDALAREAVVFDRAYAHAPQTLPSHASIFTGLLPFEHNVRDNAGFTLPDTVPTLASLFQAAGYRTAGFVSSYILRAETGIGRGFDVYDATFTIRPGQKASAQVQRPGPDTLAVATDWLDRQTDPKFFLFFHLYEPHTPYTPPAEFASLDPYDGEVAYADQLVGRLFDVLKRKGWYDPATLVVLSDHGEGLGDHGEREHGLFVYNSTIHVPWITKLPGDRSAGRRVATPIQHIDLLPTLADLAGFSPPAGLRGRDLAGVLAGRGEVPAQGIYSEALYGRYHFGWSELMALTDERYRYIRAPREELYDLDRDAGERTNLIDQRGQAAAAMRSGLDALVAGRALEAQAPVSAEDRQRLAALGYVGTSSSVPMDRSGLTLPDPKDKVQVLAQYHDATSELAAGDVDNGLRDLKQILDANPGMTDVWEEYATTLVQLGRNAEALEAFKGEVRSNPTEPGALLGAAGVLIAMGRFAEAKPYAELAITGDPATAHQTLSDIALAMRNPDEAVRQAQLVEAADSSRHVVDLVRGRIGYLQGRYKEALPFLLQARKAASGQPADSPDLDFMIGDSFARLERYSDAEHFLLEQIQFFPGDARARAALAALYHAQDREADAERAIADMLRASPTPAAYQAAANLWDAFGQPKRAAAVRAAARDRFGK